MPAKAAAQTRSETTSNRPKPPRNYFKTLQNHSKPAPNPFRNHSETTPKRSITTPKPLQNRSKPAPNPLRNRSETTPKPLQTHSETTPRPHPASPGNANPLGAGLFAPTRTRKSCRKSCRKSLPFHLLGVMLWPSATCGAGAVVAPPVELGFQNGCNCRSGNLFPRPAQDGRSTQR